MNDAIERNWKIQETSDKDHVAAVREALSQNDGSCPCALERTDATVCACDKFARNCTDPNWFGQCDCGLYEKVRM